MLQAVQLRFDPYQVGRRAFCARFNFSRQRGKTTMKTDTQLQQDVSAELKWEPSVDAAQIESPLGAGKLQSVANGVGMRKDTAES